MAATYYGSLRDPMRHASTADVQDPSAQELFLFLRTQTEPSDLLVFSKPRTISLFTGRMATSLGPEETPADSAQFLQSASAKFLIQAAWNPPAYSKFVAREDNAIREIFRNRDFQVFRVGCERKTKAMTILDR